MTINALFTKPARQPRPNKSPRAVQSAAAPFTMLECLESRQLMSAAPTATFLQYIKGTGDSRTFSVLYAGPAPINRATLNSSDISVFGPNEFSAPATFLGSTRYQPGTGTVAKYRVDGIGGGLYTIFVRDQAIADTAENFVAQGTVGAFRVGRRGRTVPSLPPAQPGAKHAAKATVSTPLVGTSVVVLGTTYGSVSQPPPIDTSFGSVLMALNFGGSSASLPATGGSPIPLDATGVINSASPATVRTYPLTVSIASQGGGNDLYNNSVGGDPVYMTEIASLSQTEMTINISGLLPTQRYRFQFLHGDSRAGQLPYITTTQIFKLPTGEHAESPLAFATNSSDATSITTVDVFGTTALYYTMPNSGSRPPSFSGVIISVGDNIDPPPPPPPPPTPTPNPPPPRTILSGAFARKSVRFAGSFQTFDVIYTPTDSDNIATATALAETNVIVTGPSGYAALATLLHYNTNTETGITTATYQINGIDTTSRYSIAINDQPVASTTLFYLVPDQWETGVTSRRRHHRGR